MELVQRTIEAFHWKQDISIPEGYKTIRSRSVYNLCHCNSLPDAIHIPPCWHAQTDRDDGNRVWRISSLVETLKPLKLHNPSDSNFVTMCHFKTRTKHNKMACEKTGNFKWLKYIERLDPKLAQKSHAYVPSKQKPANVLSH